ncbi:Coenzyme Q-binding protein coq10, mitochondrial [Tolypocladium ophioglossoides CBS 100239]|uniref:Coenzyme Q-binding protein coq10, mitochondrial n=1 Tax=Tolypocladium ophioglossoides (strain CBS 100239) TaxID=1163406 RepID=A0A0L0MXB8_TOLOC|nr:Coenzyme Q-binding protein coq10, mitochondrial [Tolypocladium ophioglossoides CBS 100239]
MSARSSMLQLPLRRVLTPAAAAAAAAPPRLALPRRRSFFGFPGGGDTTQHLAATRTLPYARDPLYELIADVDSYHRFVPYCSLSRVTHWAPPDPRGRREAFSSRLRCVPGVSVEAVSGRPAAAEAEAASAVFKSLVTRWSLEPVAHDPASPSTEVRLTIEYQFVNPLYAAVSAAVSDKVASLMIEAFEKQARESLASTRKP